MRAYPSGMLQIGREGEEPLTLHPEPRLMFHGLGGVRIEPSLTAPLDGYESQLVAGGAVVGAAGAGAAVAVVAAMVYALRALPRLACRLLGQ